jgi:enoyl-CoA hydratase/carnithine racemase
MEYVKYKRAGPLAVIELARGKANAMNDDMVDELMTAVTGASADESVRGVVLASDRPKFFSGGFDVIEVFQYDREKMSEFFGRFIDLYESLRRLPKPVVGAVSGHAFAGGAILALACDFRVMAEGDFGFALNEINLGFVLTPGMITMALEAAGPVHARELLLSGSSLTPARAREIGLAAELAPSEEVLERALVRAAGLAEKPAQAFAALKRSLIEKAGHTEGKSDRDALGDFLDQWFSPEAEQRKRALVESLRR